MAPMKALKTHLTRKTTVTLTRWEIYLTGAWPVAFILLLRRSGWYAATFYIASQASWIWLDDVRAKRARREEERREAAADLQEQLIGHAQVPAETYYHPVAR